MPMKPLAGLFLALACVLGIAATGCVFELAYGDPDLGIGVARCLVALDHFLSRFASTHRPNAPGQG